MNKAYWCIGILVMLLVGCDSLGSGYTAEQIAAIQQGTPVSVALTAFPVTYAPTRPVPASVGTGGESAAANAQATLIAVTRIAGEQTRAIEDATRNAGDATRVSVALTQDAAAFQNELASANIQLAAEQQLTGLQVTLAAQAMTATIQAMSDQAMIDAADVRSAEQQLYWFEQVQRAEAEKRLAQARFWTVARYVAMVVSVVGMGGFAYWWFYLRPHQEIKVVKVDGREVMVVKTPQGYAPVVTRMQTSLPEPRNEPEPEPEMDDNPGVVEPADWGVFMNWPDSTRIPLGLLPNGRPLAVSVANDPHLMIAGTTRSGKSGMGLLPYACGMGALGAQVVLVNGRGIDFLPLEGRDGFTILPRVEGPQLIQLVGEMLDALVNEMLRRDAVLRQYTVHNWLQLPPHSGQPGEVMVAIDEFLHVVDEADEVEPNLGHKMWFALKRLTNEGGKYGISVAVTVTNPTAKELGADGMTVRSQMGRIAFRMKGAAASRTFLDVGQRELPNGTVGLPVGAFAAAFDGPIRQAVSFRPSAQQVVAYLNKRQSQARAMPDMVSRVIERGVVLLPQSHPREASMTDLITESQAEADADLLLAKYNESGGYRSRRQVALRVAGNDDPDGYDRGDEALKVLRGRGTEWATRLLTTDARYNA